MSRTCLFSSAALALIIAAPAWGQSKPAQAPADSPQTDPSSDTSGIGDIVVTAERRSESVQKSSVSIEVITGPQLSAVTKPSDLTNISPGIQVGTSGVQPQVYIRGVGDTTVNSRTQGAVAFNVDGIYYARGTQFSPSLFDISRIEVLKGPQGTLYGRNASGGAVNVITVKPQLNTTEGFVEGEVGNFALKRFSGAVNLPLSSTIAVRFAGQVIDRDGYTSDGGQDQRNQAVRMRGLWQPSDTVSLLLNGDYAHINGNGSGTVVKPSPDGDPWRGNVDTPLAFPFIFNAATAPLTTPNDRYIESNTLGASAELNVNLGFATLTVVPSYRDQDIAYTAYTSNFRFHEEGSDRQTTLEARLGNDSRILKWVAGYYYYGDKQDLGLYPLATGTLTGAVKFNQKIVAHAGFAQATLTVAKPLRIIGGVRYTSEKVSGIFQTGRGAAPIVPFTPTGAPVDIGSLSYDKVNYKVGAEFDLGPRSLLYATYATGFKAGGFVQTVACGAVTYKPEQLEAFTVGSRNRFFDNKLQVNAEAFRWKYRDQQISFTGNDSCGGITNLTRNPGNATIEGANIDIVVKPTANDTLRLAGEYTHAVYDTFLLTQFGLGAYAPTGGTRCSSSAAAGRAGFFDINCAGQQIPRTPEWSGTASYRHDFNLAGGKVSAGGNAVYASSRWLDFAYLPNGRGSAYVVFNADLIYTSPSGRVSVTGYADNISNKAVYTSGNNIVTRAPNGFRYYTANIQPPRTYGVRTRFNF